MKFNEQDDGIIGPSGCLKEGQPASNEALGVLVRARLTLTHP